MARNTTIVWICGLLLVAVGGTGGCGWSNSRARGLHLWKQDHVTYRFRNFPFVPSNAVGQCPAPGDCPTEFIEPPFFGYHDTCWRRWPEGWEPCPVEPVAEVEEVEPESVQPESPSPSPSDRPEDSSSATPAPAKEPDSVIVPATPKEAPKTRPAPSQPPKQKTPVPKPETSHVDAPKTETPKPAASPPKTSNSQDTPPKPASPKKSEAPTVPKPAAPGVEKRTPKAAPDRQPPKPTAESEDSVPQAPSFFPGASRVQSAPAEVVGTSSRQRAARSVPPLLASEAVPVPQIVLPREPADHRQSTSFPRVPRSQRLRRSLRDRMRLASTGVNSVEPSTSQKPGSLSPRPAVATRVSAQIKAKPIPLSRKLAGESREHHSGRNRADEPKRISPLVPARPISAITSSPSTENGSASRPSPSSLPEPVIIDAEKLRAAEK